MHNGPNAPGRRRVAQRGLCALALAIALTHPSAGVSAADNWVEIKSPHVTVLSSGSAGEARTLAWQLEQIRAALTKILPWVNVDLDRPFVALAVDHEQKMRALAPAYWERSGGIRPESVWVTGADQYYLAIRSDLRSQDREYVHPHVSAYFSYISLVLQQSIETDMPLWFTRGLAGVLSNTIVRDSYLLVGPPIPWHLEYLRERSRLRLPVLISVTRASKELTSDEGLARFDAQAWAFVHFLMFADNGVRAPKINQFFSLVTNGTAPDVAMAESIGKVDELEREFVIYLNRSIFQFSKMTVDVSVKRDGFAQRPVPPAESSSSLALFHAAMRRPVEARAQIAEARKAGTAPDSHVAEAILLDREGKTDEARTALARGVSDGTTNAYAYYRLAQLRWQPKADREALAELDKLLTRSIQLNAQQAWGYAMLAEVRSLLGATEAALGLALRAVKLEPAESGHRLTAARILYRADRPAEATKAAQAALTLASTDEDRQRAKELLDVIERAKVR